MHAHPDPRVAHAELRPHLDWYLGEMHKLQPDTTPPPAEVVLDTFCVVGSPAECVERIDGIRREHGIAEFIAVPGIGGMDRKVTDRVLADLASVPNGAR